MTRQARPQLLVSVDRIEKSIAVMEAEDGRTFEVPVKSFADRPMEGMMYRVPVDSKGEPVWEKATVDHKAAADRKADLSTRMAKLRRKDPGGDLKL